MSKKQVIALAIAAAATGGLALVAVFGFRAWKKHHANAAVEQSNETEKE